MNQNHLRGLSLLAFTWPPLKISKIEIFLLKKIILCSPLPSEERINEKKRKLMTCSTTFLRRLKSFHKEKPETYKAALRLAQPLKNK